MISRRSFTAPLYLVVALALFISACAPAAAPTAIPTQPPAATAITATQPPSPTTAPAEPKVVTITFVQEPDTLSPLYTGQWFSAITRQFWGRGLWSFDDNNQPVPQMALEVPTVDNGGITNDGKTLTIKLNPDAVWSDGTPVTADDLVFTYEMYVSDKNAVQTTYPYGDYIESVDAQDDHTVVINFTEPFAPWLTTVFSTDVLPAHILRPVFAAEGTLDNADWNRAPTVGFGPFVFTEWESGSHLIFEKNPNWYGEPAKVDRIFVQIVPDDAAQEAAIKAGNTDIGVFLDYSQVDGINGSGNATVVTVPSGYDEGWFMNVSPETAHPAMLDVNARRAIALATDRNRITNDLLLGLTQPAVTFWDTTPPYADPDLEAYPYDPEEAKKLLDEAGWVDSNGDGTRDKDGVELVLRYITNTRQLRKDVQAVVQQMWAEVGIGAELVNHSSDVFWNTYGDGGPQALGDFDVSEYSSNPAFPDPEASQNWLCSEIPGPDNPEGANWQGYCNEKLDALFKEEATTVDPEKRKELFYQIEQIMYDEVLWIGIWRDPDLWSLSTRLTGVKLSGATPFWNASDWDIKQ